MTRTNVCNRIESEGDAMRGKLIVIEGTDCSGKETQSRLLKDRLRKEGYRIEHFSYPNYTSPTGKIIGGSYLGKKELGPCIFPEGPSQVDPKVASLYYAADRKYNIHKITYLLENGVHVILDRYVYSNMAHQGGKLQEKDERAQMYHFLDTLEFDLLELPKPDFAIFLHVPKNAILKLMKNREYLDELEKSEKQLENSENAYLELTQKYGFYQVECFEEELKSIEEIHEEVYQYVKQKISE